MCQNQNKHNNSMIWMMAFCVLFPILIIFVGGQQEILNSQWILFLFVAFIGVHVWGMSKRYTHHDGSRKDSFDHSNSSTKDHDKHMHTHCH